MPESISRSARKRSGDNDTVSTQHVSPIPAQLEEESATRKRRFTRAERMIRAIRSVLAGVSLSIVCVALAVTTAFGEPVVSHTIRSGDSLLGIANQYGSRVSEIQLANRISDPDKLQVGEVLKIPGGRENGELVQSSSDLDRSSPSTRGSRSEVSRNFAWPLRGAITTYFAERGPYWSRGWHPGLDIGAPIGTPIRACADGVVIESESTGNNSGYGSYVKIDHGSGLVTLYGHMSTVRASVGDTVSVGSILGAVGMTGFTTGPHLHLEFRQGGPTNPIDPLLYLP